jgi:hypothetical protein
MQAARDAARLEGCVAGRVEAGCDPSSRHATNATATTASWPSSTPRLKVRSATGRWLSGSPISLTAPAKPRPCTRPNRKATTAGKRRDSVWRACSASTATSTIDSAIVASTGGGHRVSQPSALSASTNNRWSMPPRMCSTPSTPQAQAISPTSRRSTAPPNRWATGCDSVIVKTLDCPSSQNTLTSAAE